MKKLAIALAAALMAASFASAQANLPQTSAPTQAQLSKVTGKLELVQGVIAIKTNGKTYLLPRLQKVAGFIKGVEEGGTVTVEGYERALPYTADVVILQATKLTVGGKDYDLGQPGQGAMMGGKMRGMMMQGKSRGGNMQGGRW
jgi:hypothetical protein